MGGVVRVNEVRVQQPGIRPQDGVEAGAGHDGASCRELPHPEDGRRVRVLLRLSGGHGETAERGRHPLDGLVDGCGLVQIDPGDTQVRDVREPFVGDLAALDRARQLDIVTVQHVITIS